MGTIKNDELQITVDAVLDALPCELVIDWACRKLGLQTHDQWMDSCAGASEMRRER